MDALALLCNLYGDGPATLARLRGHGIASIEDLEQRRGKDLSAWLDLTPAGARRFLKEASALKERVLDPGAPNHVTPKEPAPPAPAREVLRGKQAMLDAAARRWSELERSAPAPRPLELKPRTGGRAHGTPLSVETLERATHDALASAGVATLEELLERDSESLAAEAHIGLSQVLFAQGLARRRLRDASQRTVVPTPAPGPGACAAVAVLSAHPAGEREHLPVHLLEPAARPRSRFSPSERPPKEWLSFASEPEVPAPARDASSGPFA